MIYVSTFLSMNIWFVSRLLLLLGCLCTFLKLLSHSYTFYILISLCSCTSISERMKFLGCIHANDLLYTKMPTCCWKGCACFQSHQQYIRIPLIHILTMPDVIRYSNFVNLMDIKLYLTVMLISISLIKKVGHCDGFMYQLGYNIQLFN